MDSSNDQNILQSSVSMPDDGLESSLSFSGKVKIDLKTPLELLFFIVAILSGIVVFLGFFILLTAVPIVAKDILKVSLPVFVVTLACYLKTDNYYILDCDGKYLLYHFKFFVIERVSLLAHFRDIHAVTVEGQHRQQQDSSWWEYRTVILLASKKIIPITDFERDGYLVETGFEVQKKKAEDFAKITGATLVEPEPEKTVKVKPGADGRYTFELRPISFMDNLKILAIIVITLASMIGVLSMALSIFHK